MAFLLLPPKGIENLISVGIICVRMTVSRVRSQFRPYGICDGQNGTRAGFLRVLRLPLSILIPPTAAHSSYMVLIPKASCNKQI
jgi:hypothetical protein